MGKQGDDLARVLYRLAQGVVFHSEAEQAAFTETIASATGVTQGQLAVKDAKIAAGEPDDDADATAEAAAEDARVEAGRPEGADAEPSTPGTQAPKRKAPAKRKSTKSTAKRKAAGTRTAGK